MNENLALLPEDVRQSVVGFDDLAIGDKFCFVNFFTCEQIPRREYVKVHRIAYHRASGGETCLLHSKNPLVIPRA